MRTTSSCLGIVFLVLLIAMLSAFITGFIIFLLWNWLIPLLFGGPTITYWVGVGIGFALGIIGGFFKTSIHSG